MDEIVAEVYSIRDSTKAQGGNGYTVKGGMIIPGALCPLSHGLLGSTRSRRSALLNTADLVSTIY